jgi:hypothetical protein
MPKPAEGAERLSSGGIPSIQRALAAWYEARPEKYRRSFTRPYPIFIVAAQGGGTYAANLSAIALAKLYDRCPALKHHVFAISGVSGGSIGAGLLALLIEAEGKTEAPADGSLKCELELKSDTVGPLEERVRKLLGDDFVSPVAGTALFPELLQRFLPGSIPVIDRARAAEAALEASWRREVHSAPDAASQGFLSHWSPKSNSPMLVLNTTSVDSGRRVAIAPVNIPSSEMLKTGSVNVRSIYTHELPETLGDLPMSTALFMSARFPLVLPAAALKGQYFDAYPRYVDGGYADNSGVETAIGIMNALRSSQQKVGAPYDLSSGLKLEVEHRFSGPSPDRTPLELKLIVIGETDTSMKTDLVKEGVAELLSPVRAMYRSRIQRAEIAVERAKREFSADVIAVDREYTNLALALHTAPPTQALIAAQIARPGYCQSSKTHYDIIDAMQDRSDEGNDPQGDGFNMPDMGFVFENACSLCRIIRTVTGAGELPDTNGQCGN